jgi:hypothetical protein
MREKCKRQYMVDYPKQVSKKQAISVAIACEECARNAETLIKLRIVDDSVK